MSLNYYNKINQGQLNKPKSALSVIHWKTNKALLKYLFLIFADSNIKKQTLYLD